MSNYNILSIDFGTSSIKICFAKNEYSLFKVIATEILHYDFISESSYDNNYNILSSSKILKKIKESNPLLKDIFLVSNINTENISFLSFKKSNYIFKKNSSSNYSSLLSEKEKYNGIVVIDLGKSSSIISSYLQSKLIADDTLDIGEDEITKVIADKYSKTFISCENLKKELGCAYPSLINENEKISIIVDNECIDVSYRIFSSLISSKLKSICLQLKKKLNSHPRNGYYSNGIAVIGGGALLRGSTELISDVFNTECRIGFPLAFEGLDRLHINPIYVNALSMAYSFYKNK